MSHVVLMLTMSISLHDHVDLKSTRQRFLEVGFCWSTFLETTVKATETVLYHLLSKMNRL